MTAGGIACMSVTPPCFVPGAQASASLDDCAAYFSAGSDCEQCADAISKIETTVIFGLLTQFLQVMTDIQRSTERGDRNCQKFMGIFTGILGSITTLIALSSFSQSCWKIDDPNYTIKAGSGFILVSFATFLKAIDVVAHALLPTPYQQKLLP